MSDTVQGILDSAERFIRRGGFHAFSFRQIAEEIGIKSASVHYYFPKKEDLGVAVVRRYGEAFLEALHEAAGPNAGSVTRLAAFTQVFRANFEATGRICLCGVIGAEAQGVPDPVRAEVSAFMTACVAWLEETSKMAGHTDPRTRAMTIMAALEGAMMLAVNLEDAGVLDRVADDLLAL